MTPVKNKSDSEIISEVCRYMQSCDTEPRLENLAQRAGLSKYHFHRLFKAKTGLTPKEYIRAFQGQRLRKELQEGATITDAMLEAGFNSSGRFYEAASGLLGMTPSEFRRGGNNTRIFFAVGQCSLGAILVAQSDRGVCAIFLGDDPDVLVSDLQNRFSMATLVGADQRFEQVVAKVVAYVESPGIGLDLPLDVRGTAFQQRVWNALSRIPLGSTATYTDIAELIGAPHAVRAVANACGANPLAVVIPCHRVVRNDGQLSGYRWGIERKRTLLEREAAEASLKK